MLIMGLKNSGLYSKVVINSGLTVLVIQGSILKVIESSRQHLIVVKYSSVVTIKNEDANTYDPDVP